MRNHLMQSLVHDYVSRVQSLIQVERAHRFGISHLALARFQRLLHEPYL